MTKQEEMREWVARKLHELRSDYPWDNLQKSVKDERRGDAGEILSYLHSQGVVIKVDRELPDTPYWKQHRRAVEREVTRELLKAGYVAVGPLIKEE